jgi:hypothetical protein
MRWLARSLFALLSFVISCSSGDEYHQALCAIVDVSGTYVDQVHEVARVIRTGVLPQLLPGDSLVIIRIDSQSYEKANIVTKVTLDHRPSHANAQKLGFARELEAFADEAEHSEFTDIPGALMLCSDHLKETEAGSKAILLFSDLQEDLPAGTSRELRSDEFEGIRVVAINVKRLRGDNVNPEAYRQRLAAWDLRVSESAAMEWKVIVDPAKLPPYLESIRR